MKKYIYLNNKAILLTRLSVLRSILLLVLFTVAVFSFPQVAKPFPDIIPSSPTVASIEKFGNYPITYNTGTVGVSVDLYSFSLGKGLNVDVQLSYHTSGIKVEDVSGRVGTGWTLFAGGCISRQIKGKKDEGTAGSGFYNFINNHKGYVFPDMSLATSASVADSIARDIKDSSPDLFSLSLLGRSYKFYVGNDGELHTIPYSNLKFSKHPLNSITGGSWEITDESGIRYIFGLIETTESSGKINESAWWLTSIVSAEGSTLASFEYTACNPVYAPITRSTLAFEVFSDTRFPKDLKDSYLGEKSNTTPVPTYDAYDLSKINIPGKGYIAIEASKSRLDQAWKLISEIRHYDNNNALVNKYGFTYENVGVRPFLTQILKTGSDGITVKHRAFTYYPGLPGYTSKSQDIWGYYNGATNASLYPFDGSIAYNYLYTSADRYPTDKAVAGSLKEIIYPTGGKTLLEFENNKVYGTDNVYTIKKENVSHTQSDYGEVTSPTFSTVSQKVNMSIEMAIHPMELYSLEIRLIRTDNNQTMLHYTNTSVPGNDFVYKGTDSNGMERFVCTKSGYTLSAGTYKWVTSITNNDFRPGNKPSPIIISNDYYRTIVTTETKEKLVGGIRIAKISNYGNDGKLIGKTSYSYLNKSGIGSGIGAPKSGFVKSYVVTENGCPGGAFPCYVDMKVTEIGEVDLNQYSGSAVQYTFVTEERIGEGSASLKTEYEYRQKQFVRNIIPHQELGISYAPYSPNDYEEGLLLSKTDYEYKNNAYSLIRKETNTYTVKDQGSDIPAFTAIWLSKYYTGPLIPPRVVQMDHRIKYQMGTYDYRSAKVFLSSKKTEEVTPQGTVTNINDYFYENTTYQQPTRSTQTGSDGLVSETSYKYCYDESTTVTNDMKARNILSPPLHTSNKVNNKQVKLTDVIYDVFSGNILEPKTVRTQTAASTPYSEMTYHNYDKYGNPVYLSKNGADQTFFLWSYNGQYPIAEIRNMAYTYTEVETAIKSVFSVADINALSALSIPNETKLKDGSLQKALPNAIVSTYTYKPLIGMLTATDPSGITTYYTYDSFGRLKEAYIYKDNVVSAANKQVVQSYDYHYQNQ